MPLSQVATGVVRYKGAREVELWKSSHGGDTMADSIMEVVGTATLLGDASSYMLLCASAEVPHEQNVLRLLMLPYGLGHVSDNSMCLVNLTGSDLEIQLDERKFIILSESHYDFKIDDARRNKVHIVAGVKPLQTGSQSSGIRRTAESIGDSGHLSAFRKSSYCAAGQFGCKS